MTTCKILQVDETKGIIRVVDIDAFDGTPIVDLKAYFPVCDRLKSATIPNGFQIGQNGCQKKE